MSRVAVPIAFLPLLLLGLVAVPARGQVIAECFPLHAVETESGGCQIDDPCDPGPPTTSVSPGVPVTVYLLARDFAYSHGLMGVQTAFEWHDWTLLSGAWDCQSNQVVTAMPTGPGPTDGRLITTFDCVESLETIVIGRLFMIPTAGLLYQVEPDGPESAHGLDCSGRPLWVPWWNWGQIEVEGPGYDACVAVGPVESASWGAVKGQYR